MKFEKVSYEQFKKDLLKAGMNFNEEKIRGIYNSIVLPTRGTKNSAGYDFRLPYDLEVKANESTSFLPTGIKCEIDDDKVLVLAPRSSLGTKYGFQLSNTLGIIDADYYNNPDNEGDIAVKFKVEVDMSFKANDRIVQGIIMKYYKIDDDNADKERSGGFGSTGKI